MRQSYHQDYRIVGVQYRNASSRMQKKTRFVEILRKNRQLSRLALAKTIYLV